MKVVVTGGAGFIGANLCRALVADPGVGPWWPWTTCRRACATTWRVWTVSRWSRVRSWIRTPSTRSSPVPPPSSTWRPVPRCPDRWPTPWPATTPTPPAPCRCWRRRDATVVPTSSWRRRRPSTAPTRPCPSARTWWRGPSAPMRPASWRRSPRPSPTATRSGSPCSPSASSTSSGRSSRPTTPMPPSSRRSWPPHSEVSRWWCTATADRPGTSPTWARWPRSSPMPSGAR